MTKQTYKKWAWQVVECILADAIIPAEIKIAEIKCVLYEHEAYRDFFDEGCSPKDTWAEEVEAIKAEAEPIKSQ